MARILLGSVGIMKRMFTGAVERWTDEGRPRYVATVERWKAESWREKKATEILDGVRALSEAAIDAYMALVSGVIPAAWISEGLFTLVYNVLVKRRDAPPAPAYLMGYDNVPVRAEKALYDLAQWAREQEDLAAHLGADPHARQQAAAERREGAVQVALERLRGLRLRLFRRTLGSAQRYAPLREDGLADVGLAYPLLRQMLREVGERLVEGGAIGAADDVYWLTEEQVVGAAAALDRGEALSDLTGSVVQHKVSWRAARQATPPLGLFKVMGKMMVKGETRKGGKRDVDTLKGVAASPGRVTAPACVLHGPEDFHRMKTGDVLVAALTTPAWTPLFARAAAVVTDIGGPLSHGSIVAREYGIPAVLGTGEATRRIESGQVITVDGTAGTVALA
jgi:phosphohistidine swiveling domain-containing protein